MTTSLCCVVPAFDAELTVAAVIGGLRRSLPDAPVIGVDDGSRDGTASILHATCDHTVVLGTNQGKGAALRAGFRAALARGCTAVLTIDADGQHDPALASAVVAALGEADIVIGSRQRTRTSMPFHRRLTNALSSAAISAAAGCRIADTQSGYRALRADVVASIRPAGDRYEFETEFLIQAGRAGFRIACVPVPTIYGCSRSHFRDLRDGTRVIRTILQYHLGRVG